MTEESELAQLKARVGRLNALVALMTAALIIVAGVAITIGIHQ